MQSVMPSLPNSEKEFPGQCRHADPSVTFRYDPAPHSEHIPDPFTPLYFPTGQAEQAAPPDPSYPIVQIQSESSSLPRSEVVLAGHETHVELSVSIRYVPSSHRVHDPDPFVGLYDPAVHAVHLLPPDPSNPTLQMQSVMSSLPNSEFVFAGQIRHADPSVTFRYSPAAQSEHVPDPLTPLYLPSEHAVQATPLDPSYPILHTQSVIASLPTSEFV